MEEEFDDFSDTESEPDNYFYGEISKNITYETLISIMADALYKYAMEKDIVDKAQLMNVLDLWIEHDTSNNFSHLITEDKVIDFFEKVRDEIGNLE